MLTTFYHMHHFYHVATGENNYYGIVFHVADTTVMDIIINPRRKA